MRRSLNNLKRDSGNWRQHVKGCHCLRETGPLLQRRRTSSGTSLRLLKNEVVDEEEAEEVEGTSLKTSSRTHKVQEEAGDEEGLLRHKPLQHTKTEGTAADGQIQDRRGDNNPIPLEADAGGARPYRQGHPP